MALSRTVSFEWTASVSLSVHLCLFSLTLVADTHRPPTRQVAERDGNGCTSSRVSSQSSLASQSTSCYPTARRSRASTIPTLSVSL